MILALLVAAGTTIKAQENPDEYLGLPGDNLNLYAVMNLFQESETLEGFERKLNEENSRINNLDLNGDNFVDYLMVTDYVDGEDHNIVLSVALSRNEKQDVAVFTVQRLRNGSVQIQLIGDEELYGRNYIIEPIFDDNAGETPNPGYTGRTANRQNVTVVRTTTYEIAAWPMIRFIYRPDYVIWRSAWSWGYYPSYWHSWSPFYYHYYYGYHSNWYPVYYKHYRHWSHPRYSRYNDFYYTSIRTHSPQVSVRIKEGNYKTTYSRPDQRRDGEALYSRTRSGGDSKSTGNQERRSVSQQSNDRTSSGTSRRSTENNTVKSRTNTTSGQNAGTTRRSTANDPGRTVSKQEPARKSESASRSKQPASNAGSSKRSGDRGSTTKTSSEKSKNTEKETAKSSKRR